MIMPASDPIQNGSPEFMAEAVPPPTARPVNKSVSSGKFMLDILAHNQESE